MLGQPVTSPLNDYAYVKTAEQYDILIYPKDPRELARALERVQKEICKTNYCRAPEFMGQAWRIIVTPK